MTIKNRTIRLILIALSNVNVNVWKCWRVSQGSVDSPSDLDYDDHDGWTRGRDLPIDALAWKCAAREAAVCGDGEIHRDARGISCRSHDGETPSTSVAHGVTPSTVYARVTPTVGVQARLRPRSTSPPRSQWWSQDSSVVARRRCTLKAGMPSRTTVRTATVHTATLLAGGVHVPLSQA